MNKILIAVSEEDYLRAMVIAGAMNNAARRAGNPTTHSISGVLTAAASVGLERVREVLNLPQPETITLDAEQVAEQIDQVAA